MAGIIDHAGKSYEALFSERPDTYLTILEVTELGNPNGIYFEIELPDGGMSSIANVVGAVPLDLIALAARVASNGS